MRHPFEAPAVHHLRLARRAAAGDRPAFVELYRALYPPVARYVAVRATSQADAEDLVALTFHRLLEALPSLDGARGTVLGWCLATARNAAADQRRARLRPGPGGEAGPGEVEAAPDGAPDALSRLEADERLQALARVLDALPPDARELIERRFGDGLSHAEIAALGGLREAAVRKRLSRAIAALRAGLAAAALGGDEDRTAGPTPEVSP